MYVIAHLSDPHLDGTEEARSRLRLITSYVRSSTVDVVLVTGDLADHGLPEEYVEVARELTFDVPTLVLPGNHDVSAAFRALVTAPGHGHPVHQIRDVGAARFVLVDSTVEGQDHGYLSGETLAWLDTALTDPFDGPIFVAMHHPPFELHHPVMDQWKLENPDALEQVLTGKPVTAVLTGHVHNAITTTFAGHPVLGAPGIRSTVPLPFEPHTDSVVDPTAHPGLALHFHTPGQPLQTVYRYPVQ
ncbi:3',5'-cyclic AMP phosphodiesterase CpdA [Kribbella aluminosa]|uniref:3',5'-cyclic AMP phosphodiesterase CpdA n=1 Tax=Kribbella aluminosa TaxID=416017 RepID=A0ABS4UMG8_9ACTN|nr:metallophosphoesterase [Kribbella aluminosa]MBP2352810.1 3',5'-cyclic AMP phosphodiesterase CpdA [Kribbella aluminosa]